MRECPIAKPRVSHSWNWQVSHHHVRRRRSTHDTSSKACQWQQPAWRPPPAATGRSKTSTESNQSRRPACQPHATAPACCGFPPRLSHCPVAVSAQLSWHCFAARRERTAAWRGLAVAGATCPSPLSIRQYYPAGCATSTRSSVSPYASTYIHR